LVTRVVQAEAAATLTGLVFVAVSINLAKIIAFPGLPSRAAESILQFLQVLFICTVALIPPSLWPRSCAGLSGIDHRTATTAKPANALPWEVPPPLICSRLRFCIL
jgi:hypothetical protein